MKKKTIDGPQDAYWKDEALMRRLGLKRKGYLRDWTRIGTVRCDLSRADVDVSAMPAHFWRFTVHRCLMDEPLVIMTGSGALADYWPFVEMLLAGQPLDVVTRAADLVVGEEMFRTEESALSAAAGDQ